MAFGKRKEERAAADRKRGGGAGFVIGVECIYFLLGATLLFVPQIQMIHICYALSAVLVFMGILQIVRYFMAESYRNINEYGFSFGVLEVILGMCALVRAQAIVSSFLVVVGIGLLLTAVIKLQYALDLKSMSDFMWIPAIVLAAALIAGAVCVLVNPFMSQEALRTFTYYLLMADGVLGIMGNVYLFIRVRLYSRKERREASEEAPATARSEKDWAKEESFAQEEAEAPVGTQENPSANQPDCSTDQSVDDWLSEITKAEEGR